jgi:hypothetical protein
LKTVKTGALRKKNFTTCRAGRRLGSKKSPRMSMVLWIVEEGLEGDKSTPDLWALYHFSEELDKLCEQAGVKKLTLFHDLSVVSAEFDEETEPKLSDPSELLMSLRKVRDGIAKESRPFVSHGKDRRADVLKDLDEAIRVAGDCQSKGKRVRLSVIP